MRKFLNLQPEAFGLDISDLSLKIVKFEKKGDGFTLASFGETKVKPGIIKGGEVKEKKEFVRAIRKAVVEVKGKKIKTKNVIASLPEEKAFLQVIQMPKIPKEDLKSAVIYEAENYIPFPLEEVYLDSQIVPPLHNHLDHYDVFIAALPKKIVDPYFDCLKEADLKPVALEIESLSIARALIKEQTTAFPVLILDLGTTKTNFIIFSGCSLRFTFSIPISSHGLTEAVAKVMKNDLGKAEKLKIEHGLGKLETTESCQVFDALIPSLTDLVEQLRRRLDYYRDHAAHEHLPPNGKQVEKVLLSGGGANLKGLAEFLSQELKLPVELGNPWINILPKDKKEKPVLSVAESLTFTSALGLALRAMEDKR